MLIALYTLCLEKTDSFCIFEKMSSYRAIVLFICLKPTQIINFIENMLSSRQRKAEKKTPEKSSPSSAVILQYTTLSPLSNVFLSDAPKYPEFPTQVLQSTARPKGSSRSGQIPQNPPGDISYCMLGRLVVTRLEMATPMG